MAVNQQYAWPDTKLNANDEVALLPPVSGGTAQVAGLPPSEEPVGGRHYASITRQRIYAQRILDELKRGEDGAALLFEGVVRNQTRGRKTMYLDYEAYEDMALQQMESLA